MLGSMHMFGASGGKYGFVATSYSPGVLSSTNDTSTAFASVYDSIGNLYTVGDLAYLGVSKNMIVTKYSSNGTVIWQKTYAVAQGGSSSAFDIDCDTNGDIYVVGYNDTSGTDFGLVMKINSSGTIVWQKLLQDTSISTGPMVPRCIVADTYSCTIVADRDATPGSGNWSYWIALSSSDGTQQFTRKFSSGATDWNFRSHCSQTNTGNVYIVGDYTSTTYTRAIITKLSPAVTGSFGTNNLAWSKHAPDLYTTLLTDVVAKPGITDTGCYAVGRVNIAANVSRAALFEFDINGNIVQQAFIENNTGNFSNSSYGIALDSTGNIFVSTYISDGTGTSIMEFNSSFALLSSTVFPNITSFSGQLLRAPISISTKNSLSFVGRCYNTSGNSLITTWSINNNVPTSANYAVGSGVYQRVGTAANLTVSTGNASLSSVTLTIATGSINTITGNIAETTRTITNAVNNLIELT